MSIGILGPLGGSSVPVAVPTSSIGIVTPVGQITVDPCAPTLSVATLVSADIASLEASLSSTLTDAELTILNALNIPGLQALLNSVQAISASLSLGGLACSPGASVFAALLKKIIGELIQSAINSVEKAVIDEVNKLAQEAVQQLDNAIKKVADQIAAGIQKDLSPIIQAVAAINGLLGKIEATKALVASVLNTSKTCPAAAALTAEAYFKMGAKKL
jgi:hypothetical protein